MLRCLHIAQPLLVLERLAKSLSVTNCTEHKPSITCRKSWCGHGAKTVDTGHALVMAGLCAHGTTQCTGPRTPAERWSWVKTTVLFMQDTRRC